MTEPRRTGGSSPLVTGAWTIEGRAIWERTWVSRTLAVLLLLLVGLFQSWVHLDQVQLTYEVSRQVHTLRELHTQRNLLRAEQSAQLASPNIRVLADELGMREPEWDELVLVRQP